MYLCAFSSCSRVASYKEKENKGEIEAREILMHREPMSPLNFQSTMLLFMCNVLITSVSDVFQ